MRDIVVFRSASSPPEGSGLPRKIKTPLRPLKRKWNERPDDGNSKYETFLKALVRILETKQIRYILDGSNHISTFTRLCGTQDPKEFTLDQGNLRLEELTTIGFDGQILFVAKVENMSDQDLLDNYFYHLFRDNPSLQKVWTLTVVLPRWKILNNQDEFEKWDYEALNHVWNKKSGMILRNSPRVVQVQTVKTQNNGRTIKSIAVALDKAFFRTLEEEKTFTDAISDMFTQTDLFGKQILTPTPPYVQALHDLISFDDFLMAEIRREKPYITIITQDDDLKNEKSAFHKSDAIGKFMHRVLTELLSTSTLGWDVRLRESREDGFITKWANDGLYPFKVLTTKFDIDKNDSVRTGLF